MSSVADYRGIPYVRSHFASFSRVTTSRPSVPRACLRVEIQWWIQGNTIPSFFFFFFFSLFFSSSRPNLRIVPRPFMPRSNLRRELSLRESRIEMEQGSCSITDLPILKKKITIHNDPIKARLLLLYRVVI